MNDRGIALPLVLWSITILVTTAFSLALASRTELRMTATYRDTRERRLLAQAGIERGLLEIAYRAGAPTSADADTRPWRTDNSTHEERLGKGAYAVSISDDSGKISINGLNDSNSLLLRNLLVRLGVTPENADIIVDSILDWKDEDNLHRASGAEDEYYMSLPVPYHARNSAFTAPEELLLVRGMTEELLFDKGLISFVTVYSKHGGVNLESAPRDVLLSLPGMTEPVVDSLIAYREQVPVWNGADAQALLGATIEQVKPYIGATGKGIYTLTCRGNREGEKGSFPIVATVAFDGNRFKYLYYKSPSGEGR